MIRAREATEDPILREKGSESNGTKISASH